MQKNQGSRPIKAQDWLIIRGSAPVIDNYLIKGNVIKMDTIQRARKIKRSKRKYGILIEIPLRI